jgi:hypothetical protein
MKQSETISEQTYRLRQLAIKTAKETKHQSFTYIGRGLVKKVEL